MRSTDWSDVESAATQMAGNWQEFECFAWSRGYDLTDADKWAIYYTSNRDSGLLAQSNEKAIQVRLDPFAEGDDPDLVFESHSHWAVGHVDGFSVRVFKADGSITAAFQELCRINEELDAYPVLDETDYSQREYQATLESYRCQMWRHKNLPENWEGEVHAWFSDNGKDRFTENADDQGGYASEENIIEALVALGLMPNFVIER